MDPKSDKPQTPPNAGARPPAPPARALAPKEKAAVLVHNTQDTLHSLALPAAGGNPRAQIALHRTHVLKPGVNRVPADVWELAKQQKMTQIHLDEGHLVQLDRDTDTSKMPEKPALTIIKQTIDRDLLLEWKKGEKRPKVKTALKAQLKAIEPDEDEEDEDDDE